MKSLFIPFLKDLNLLSMDQVSGFLDENGAKVSVEAINWPDKFGYRPFTTVCVGHSLAAIHIAFQVHGNYLRATSTKDNQNVNEDSCVEFFVKRQDSEFYYNFEFNCIGVCKAAKHFKTRENVKYFTSSQLKEIGRWSSLAPMAFSEIDGNFFWELCIRIPFKLIEVDPKNLPEKLLGNFYTCGDIAEQPHYVSWNPIKTEKPDFHRPEFFGELKLGLGL